MEKERFGHLPFQIPIANLAKYGMKYMDYMESTDYPDSYMTSSQ